MIDKKLCDWLLENADAPIRYRVERELLKNDKLSKNIENDLLENPTVKLWLKNLKPENPPQHYRMVHGSFNFCLENAMHKIVQLGLHAELPPVVDAVQFYIEIMKAAALNKPYRKIEVMDLDLLTNMLILAEFKDSKILEFMMGSLDELNDFASKGDYDIYLSQEERVKLKGVPKNWKDTEYFINPELTNNYGFCYPLISDIIGLTKLYGINNPETDKKINTIIDFFTNDEFHNKICNGYGILISSDNKSYYSMGWDPKYPGWFNVADYIKNASNKSGYDNKTPGYVPKLLFFAMHIVKYPAVLKTKWFSDLLCCLEEYRLENGNYLFPKEWLPEKSGYAVLGSHMSFGENRRKKNWVEIESTFYIQLLKQYI